MTDVVIVATAEDAAAGLGFIRTSRGVLRCMRCHTCRNPGLKKRCVNAPALDDAGGSVGGGIGDDARARAHAAAAPKSTKPRGGGNAAWAWQREDDGSWRRAAALAEEETAPPPSAEKSENPRTPSAADEPEPAARADAGAGEEEEDAEDAEEKPVPDERPVVLLFTTPSGRANLGELPLVDALTHPDATCCAPDHRSSYLGGARGGGDLLRLVHATAQSLTRKRPFAFTAGLGLDGDDDRVAGRATQRAGKTAASSAAADDGSRLPGPGDGAAEREIYEGEGAHACDEPGCGKTFHSVAKLRRHQLTHGDRAYRCSLPGCDKRFLDFAKLKRHWFSHEGADARPHLCPHPECGHAAANREQWRDHQLEAHADAERKPRAGFLCVYAGCGKRSGALERHEEHVRSCVYKY